MPSWTKEQLEAYLRKWETPSASIPTTPVESSPSPSQSRPASKGSSACSKGKTLMEVFAKEEELRWGKGMNKTEREYLNLFLKAQNALWKNVERETLKLRIGPPDRRCNYTPDFTAVNVPSGRLVLIEVKGAYEREDARVKRMAAARWCSDHGVSFLFAKKDKFKFWSETWLA